MVISRPPGSGTLPTALPRIVLESVRGSAMLVSSVAQEIRRIFANAVPPGASNSSRGACGMMASIWGVFATGAQDSLAQARDVLRDHAALRQRVRQALASREPRQAPLSLGTRRAAVLVPLVSAPDGGALLLTKRTDTVEQHKGQISFPGGGVKEGEALLDAALRETYEEIGVRPADVDVLGRLDDQETSVSGFLVTPFVGEIPYPSRLRLSPGEVGAILQVPLRVLLEPSNFRTEVRERGGRTDTLYFYAVGSEVVWGATARIIARFLEIVFGVPPRGAGEAT